MGTYQQWVNVYILVQLTNILPLLDVMKDYV
jgi:hypothetical protein